MGKKSVKSVSPISVEKKLSKVEKVLKISDDKLIAEAIRNMLAEEDENIKH